MNSYQKQLFSLAFACFLIFISCKSREIQNAPTIRKVDVCVYGGTASGIMSAVAASREGNQVLVVEPSRWLGGMTGGGISHIDWGNEDAVGGTTLEILKNDYNNSQYRKAFADLVRENGIKVIYQHRIAGVNMRGKTIKSITLDYAPPDSIGCPIPQAIRPGAATISAKVYIDCSYEGDLMAKSGVSYTYGRESQEQYGESLAGVEPNLTVYDIDPYQTPGDSSSGLLPFIKDWKIGALGSADKLIMGYCLRYKFDMEGDGIPIPPPQNYDPPQFELFRRGFNNGLDLSRARYMKKPGIISEKKGYFISPSGSGNTNRSLLTTTIWGCNSDYPDGDWETRSKIWKFHQEYFCNIIHFLRTDPAVPEHLKNLATKVTFMRGIFDDTQGWPHQLYVREARRMVSTYILTQKDVEGNTNPQNSIGLASYGVDEWPYAIIAVEGKKVAISGGGYSELVINEKDNGIYNIPYQSITPKADECDNLLVPVCLSASHIAMTSIRMEPVWMIIGESAGIAAALAVKNQTAVQDVDYPQLRAKLLEIGQKLDIPDQD
ncbi:MAG: FAD-dependent oxidoreductase [Candidatus Marinimicrobia bacterium]|nr:FAD-dependent oxidoreductase [Candidatus Neomarinimicrobiota bacterium]